MTCHYQPHFMESSDFPKVDTEEVEFKVYRPTAK
jgi:hypothetical protein